MQYHFPRTSSEPATGGSEVIVVSGSGWHTRREDPSLEHCIYSTLGRYRAACSAADQGRLDAYEDRQQDRASHGESRQGIYLTPRDRHAVIPCRSDNLRLDLLLSELMVMLPHRRSGDCVDWCLLMCGYEESSPGNHITPEMFAASLHNASDAIQGRGAIPLILPPCIPALPGADDRREWVAAFDAIWQMPPGAVAVRNYPVSLTAPAAPGIWHDHTRLTQLGAAMISMEIVRAMIGSCRDAGLRYPGADDCPGTSEQYGIRCLMLSGILGEIGAE